MKLFHYAPTKLNAGAIIQPGNFGRLIRGYRILAHPNGSKVVGSVWVREMILEQTRLEEQSAASDSSKKATLSISRLDCVFGLRTIKDAEAYRGRAAGGVLHEVELVDQDKPFFEGSISRLDLPIGMLVSDIYSNSRLYWRRDPGDPTQGNEVLTASPFRVLRIV